MPAISTEWKKYLKVTFRAENQTRGKESRMHINFHSMVASARGDECPSLDSILISLRNVLKVFRRLLFYKIAPAQCSLGSYLPQISYILLLHNNSAYLCV